MPAKNPFRKVEAALRKQALAYPHTTEDFPWGHSAYKVKGKMFLVISRDEGFLNVTMKLPVSGPMALTLPFASPTGYGLGKSGWVTAQFDADDEIPVDMLREWLDESFRAIAPKRVLAELENDDDEPKKRAARKKNR